MTEVLNRPCSVNMNVLDCFMVKVARESDRVKISHQGGNYQFHEGLGKHALRASDSLDACRDEQAPQSFTYIVVLSSL